MLDLDVSALASDVAGYPHVTHPYCPFKLVYVGAKRPDKMNHLCIPSLGGAPTVHNPRHNRKALGHLVN